MKAGARDIGINSNLVIIVLKRMGITAESTAAPNDQAARHARSISRVLAKGILRFGQTIKIVTITTASETKKARQYLSIKNIG